MTTQQRILFEILDSNEEFNLGDLRVRFYKIHKPRINHGYHNEMRRNSRMSAWLNSLSYAGFVYIDRYDIDNWLYKLTDLGREKLLESKD